MIAIPFSVSRIEIDSFPQSIDLRSRTKVCVAADNPIEALAICDALRELGIECDACKKDPFYAMTSDSSNVPNFDAGISIGSVKIDIYNVYFVDKNGAMCVYINGRKAVLYLPKISEDELLARKSPVMPYIARIRLNPMNPLETLVIDAGTRKAVIYGSKIGFDSYSGIYMVIEGDKVIEKGVYIPIDSDSDSVAAAFIPHELLPPNSVVHLLRYPFI